MGEKGDERRGGGIRFKLAVEGSCLSASAFMLRGERRRRLAGSGSARGGGWRLEFKIETISGGIPEFYRRKSRG